MPRWLRKLNHKGRVFLFLFFIGLVVSSILIYRGINSPSNPNDKPQTTTNQVEEETPSSTTNNSIPSFEYDETITDSLLAAKRFNARVRTLEDYIAEIHNQETPRKDRQSTIEYAVDYFEDDSGKIVVDARNGTPFEEPKTKIPAKEYFEMLLEDDDKYNEVSVNHYVGTKKGDNYKFVKIHVSEITK